MTACYPSYEHCKMSHAYTMRAAWSSSSSQFISTTRAIMTDGMKMAIKIYEQVSYKEIGFRCSYSPKGIHLENILFRLFPYVCECLGWIWSVNCRCKIASSLVIKKKKHNFFERPCWGLSKHVKVGRCNRFLRAYLLEI